MGWLAVGFDLSGGSPAAAATGNPLQEFLDLFRQQAIPREVVAFPAKHAPGTVVVSTSQRRLYYVLGNGQAIRYGVGVGREGFTQPNA